MQSYRATTRLPRAVLKPKNIRIVTTRTPSKARNMSFFRGSPFYNAEPTFTPLFRLLDDFDSYSRSAQVEGGQGNNGHHNRAHVRTFNPKFDLKETESAYELHGELPGIEKDNVHIEFTEPQTIVIRGRVERSYSAGTPSTGQLEGTQISGAITEGGEKQTQQSHKVTVEDEDEASTAQPTPASTNAELAKTDSKQVQQRQQQQEPKVKYWVSERSVGEFSRSFQFPSRIEAEGVKADLNNGILNVVVPKAKKHESRRIAIN